MTGRRGVTLAESIVASFILVWALAVLFNVLDVGINYAQRVEKQALAKAVAQKTIDKIRAWTNQTSANAYNYDVGWSTYQGVSFADPDNPEFTVTVAATTSGWPLLSPCSTEEGLYTGNQRTLPTAVVPLKVTVSWRAGNAIQQSIALVTYVGEPTRSFNSPALSINTVSGTLPLAHDAILTMQVTGTDSFGHPLSNLLYQWSVWPIDGNGTLLSSPRSGRTAQFQNHVVLPNGAIAYTSGSCIVKVRAVLHGVEQWASSSTITLQ